MVSFVYLYCEMWFIGLSFLSEKMFSLNRFSRIVFLFRLFVYFIYLCYLLFVLKTCEHNLLFGLMSTPCCSSNLFVVFCIFIIWISNVFFSISVFCEIRTSILKTVMIPSLFLHVVQIVVELEIV